MADKDVEFFNSLTGPEVLLHQTMAIMIEHVGVDRLDALTKWGKAHPEGTLGEFAQDKPGFIRAYNAALAEIQTTLSEPEKKLVQDYYKKPDWSRIAAIGDFTTNEFIKGRNDQYVKDGHALAATVGIFPFSTAIELGTSIIDATRPTHPGEDGPLKKLGYGAFNAGIDSIPVAGNIIQTLLGKGGVLLDGSLCHIVRDVTDHPGKCTDHMAEIKAKIIEHLTSGGSHVENGSGGTPDKQPPAKTSAASQTQAPSAPHH